MYLSPLTLEKKTCSAEKMTQINAQFNYFHMIQCAGFALGILIQFLLNLTWSRLTTAALQCSSQFLIE